MNIGIDCRFLLKNRRGMSKVLINLLYNLSYLGINNKHNVELCFDRSLTKDQYIEWSKLGYKIKILKCKNYFLWEQVILPLKSRKKFDCFIFMFNTGSIFLKPAKYVIGYIHDAIFMKNFKQVPINKSLYQFLGRIYRRLIVPLFCRRADRIITISNYSKKDIVYETKCDEKQIDVIYNGYNKIQNYDYSIISKYKLKEYILFLGALDPRKNTELAIKYFSEFIKRSEFKNYKLVISGIRNIDDTYYNNLIKKLDLEKSVISVGFVDDYELNALYNKARAFLFLSSYEGFGLPVLEAMYNKTPVISSKLSCLPEICGDAAMLIDPYNNNEVVNSLKIICSDDKLRDDLIQKGINRLKLYDWFESARSFLKIVDSIFN